MRLVFDENVPRVLVQALVILKVGAVHVTDLVEPGTPDDELVPALKADDILVTFDKKMLGQHTAILVENRTRVIKVSVRKKASFAQRVGVLMYRLEDAVQDLTECEPPCQVKITFSERKPARRITLPDLAYGRLDAGSRATTEPDT